MPRKPKPLKRDAAPTQRTPKGLEIPVPTEREVEDFFDRVLVKRKAPPAQPKPSESDPA